jgi:hypothetical protein
MQSPNTSLERLCVIKIVSGARKDNNEKRRQGVL